VPKQSNHNFTYFLKLKRSNTEFGIINLRYRYGGHFKIERSTGITIPVKHWDDKKKEIKIRKELKAEISLLAKIKSKVKIQTSQLLEEHTDAETALNAIFDIEDQFGTLRGQWMIYSKEKGHDKYNTTYGKINAAINNLETFLKESNQSKYIPLSLKYFQNKSLVKKFAELMFTNLSVNTATEYLENLDRVIVFNKRVAKPFQELYRSEPTKKIQKIPAQLIFDSIDKINTPLQLEGVLFWLYSFCLRGLDGQDITLISEKNIIEGWDEGTYLHNSSYSDEIDEPVYDMAYHFGLGRKKTNQFEMQVIGNAYPTPQIRKMLKILIQKNKPEWSTDNEIKIFNFDAKSDKGKWKSASDRYGQALRKVIGTSFKTTRHTFTSAADSLGVSTKYQAALIGNKDRTGSIDNYSSRDNKKLDLIHLNILDAYNVTTIWKKILNKCQFVPTEYEYHFLDKENIAKNRPNLKTNRPLKHIPKGWVKEYEETEDTWMSISDGVYRGTAK